jgi:outer membrane protein assembly factor BamD
MCDSSWAAGSDPYNLSGPSHKAALGVGTCGMKFSRALHMGALTLAVFMWLPGCALFSGKDESRAENLDKLYAEAREDIAGGSFDQAIKNLERLEARASGTLLGQQALLDLAYAQWKSGERASALASLERFTKLHPSSPAYDYALYLRGVVNFNDNLGLFGRLARQEVSERDQKASREAFQALSQLVQQFPDSKYAPDARVRMDFIVNSLAAYEVHVARYYFRRGAYLAAVNRAKQAVTEFDRVPAAEEALAIMVEGYGRLGLKDLSRDAQRVLKQNFPNSRFLSADGLEVTSKPLWRVW